MIFCFFFFLRIRRPPRSTLSSSSAASDVYKRQVRRRSSTGVRSAPPPNHDLVAVSYTHLRAHETPEHLVCRLLLEKKKHKDNQSTICPVYQKILKNKDKRENKR